MPLLVRRSKPDDRNTPAPTRIDGCRPLPASGSKLRIIYIAGYGRSGSTLLERLLGAHAEVAALGEIAYLTDDQESDYYWKQVDDSDYWCEVRNALPFSPIQLPAIHRFQRREEGIATGWWSWLLGPSAEYRDLWRGIFRTLWELSPRTTTFLIDSSKTARERFFRPFLLAQIPGVEVKVLHLVRDGRGCLWSVLKGSNLQMEQKARSAGDRPDMTAAPSTPSLRIAVKACLGWSVANLSGFLARVLRGRSHCYQVTYERFVNEPEKVLAEIEAWLDVDLSEQKARIRDGLPIPLTQQFAGNRMRGSTNVVLKKDEEWKRRLPRRYRVLYWLICWPVHLLWRSVN